MSNPTPIPTNFTVNPETRDAQLNFHRARLTAEEFDWLTIVSVAGDIDAANAESVVAHIRGFITPGRPLILDLSDLDFLGVEGVRSLCALDDACADARVECGLVASRAVRRLLRVAGRDRRVPAATSLIEVLGRVRTAGRPRRFLQLVA
ncbi:MAG: STAS domain-containing protein [Mycobacteriaceae bacterium]|nr:STAS domain-containing protein [Mycobacteriaceae bacterium]MBV9641261.1 STAS domain-containing protein [Mycobacteriaceae bacterium]